MDTEKAVDRPRTDKDFQDTKLNDENAKNEGEKKYFCGLVKKKTIILIWGTITVTLANFGYFTGGYYAFDYFHAQHFLNEQNKMQGLFLEQEKLTLKYPNLLNTTQLRTYTRTAEILCHITNKPSPIWTFWTAFDFCVTIITTVGYGVLIPSTWYSKAVCCFYAMAGLPLYLIMLGAAGKHIVSMFEYMNKKSAVVKRVCTHRHTELIIANINIAIVMGLFLLGYSYFGYSASRSPESNNNGTAVISLPGYGYLHTAGKISLKPENWSWIEAVYYSMISLTTIGFGDYNLGKPDDPRQAAMLFLSISFGFALFSYVFQTYSKASEDTLLYLQEKTRAIGQSAASAVQAEMTDRIQLPLAASKMFEDINPF